MSNNDIKSLAYKASENTVSRDYLKFQEEFEKAMLISISDKHNETKEAHSG